MGSCAVLVLFVPRRAMANTCSKAKTPRLSEDLVIVYKGESRLAMAPEGGDVRVRPHETCQSRSVALGEVKRAKKRQKTRADPETI